MYCSPLLYRTLSLSLVLLVVTSFVSTVPVDDFANLIALKEIDHTLKTLTNSVVLYSSAFNSSSSKYFSSQKTNNIYALATAQKIYEALSYLNRIMSSSGSSVFKDSNLALKEISQVVKDLNTELALLVKTVPNLASEETFKDLVKALRYVSVQFQYIDQRLSGKAESVWQESNKIFSDIRDRIGTVDKTLVAAIESMLKLATSQRSEYAAISNRFSLDLFRTQVDTSDKLVATIVESIGTYLARIESRVSGNVESVWSKSALEFRTDFSVFARNLDAFFKTFAHSHLPTHMSAHSDALGMALGNYSDTLSNRMSLNSDSLNTVINESFYFDVKGPLENLTSQLHSDFVALEGLIVNLTNLSLNTFAELHRDSLHSFEVTFAEYIQKFIKNFNNSIASTGMVVVDYFLHGIAPGDGGHSYLDGPSLMGGIADWLASALATLLEPFWRTLLLIVKEIVYLIFEAIIFLMSRLFEVFTALAGVFEREFETLFDLLYRFATLGFQTLLRVVLKIEEHILLSEYLFLFIILTYYGLPWRTAVIFICFVLLLFGVLRNHLSIVLALLNPQFKNLTFSSSIAFVGNYHPLNVDSPMETVLGNNTYIHCSDEWCITVPVLSTWNVSVNLLKIFFKNWNVTLAMLK